MKMFKADGKEWVAHIHEAPERSAKVERAGWEVVQFDTHPPGTVQRITYRPAGWLSQATIRDLIEALKEGESVRANWNERNTA
jgi:hypothetical protein